MISRESFNVAQLGTGICIIMFAFLGMTAIEQTTLSDMHKNDTSISEHAGYYSQTIIYGFFVISNLIAPPIVALIGCRWSLVIGSVGYSLFMSQFLYLSNYTLYGLSAVEGLGGGIMWTAVGFYMALNSDASTVGRNSSMLWLLVSMSNIFGGIYLLVIFSIVDSSEIDKNLRTVIFGTFTGLAVVGNIVYALIRTVPREVELRAAKRKNFGKELLATFRMIPTKRMLLLMIPAAFTGLHTSFFTAVFPTSMSYTQKFPMRSKIVLGMTNLAVGVGEIGGALACILLDRFIVRYGRRSVLAIGTILNITAFVIIGLDIPGNASYQETDNVSVIPPSPYLASLAGLLLGIVDSAFNTQLYAITASLYSDNCAQAMALCKFYHAILSTVSMFYGSVLQLIAQMAILAALSIASTVAFAVVEIRYPREECLTVKEIDFDSDGDSTSSSISKENL